MSADVLRDAARLMRQRAMSAGQGRYGFSSKWTTGTTMLTRITRGGRVVAEKRGHEGDTGLMGMVHLSHWHPDVALAVADWLDATAREFDALSDPDLSSHPLDGRRTAGLAVARAYLGDPS